MFKNGLKISLLLLICLAEIKCVLESKSNEYLKKHRYDGKYQYLFLFASLFIIGIVRYVTLLLRIPIPYSIFAMLLGMFIGIIAHHFGPVVNQLSAIAVALVMKMVPIYVPLMIFHIAFCLDVHSFFKGLWQIFLVSVPVNILSAAIVGFITKFLIGEQWYNQDALMFGILLSAIYPMESLFACKMTGSPYTKQAIVILEGETLIGTAYTLLIYEILFCYMAQWIVHWYQVVAGLARLFILGIPSGYLIGLLGGTFMRLSYNDPVILTTLTMAVCYSSFCIGELVDVGIVTTMVSGIMMGSERVALPIEVDQFLFDMWVIMGGVVNTIFYVTVGLSTADCIEENISTILFPLVTYLLCNVSRFLGFLIAFPFLRKLGYGLSFNNMLLTVWLGLKSPLCLTMWILLLNLLPHEKVSTIGFHAIIVFLLYHGINASFFQYIMRISGMLEISTVRQVNMNNCVKYILQARERTVAVLKMDRFLTDANWPMVLKKTWLKHPYKSTLREFHKEAVKKQEEEEEEEEDKQQQDDDEEDDRLMLGHRQATCPDCKKSLPSEPTPKEFKDMVREAKLRILKLKKIFYSRQYENGMISKEGVRNLHQAVESTMDTEEAMMNLDDLYKLFNKEGFFFRFIRDRFIYFLEPKLDKTQPPRKHWRRVCYRVVRMTGFEIFIYVVICCSLVSTIYSCAVLPIPHQLDFYIIYETNMAIFIAFMTEFWLKIFGYSWIYICAHGFRRYFRSWWNIVDFVAICATLMDLIVNTALIFEPSFGETTYYRLILYPIMIIRLIRVLRFLLFFSLCKATYPDIVKYLDSKIDKHRAMAYELGKNYLTGETEILENLNNIIEDEKIREMLRKIIDRDRLVLTKVIGLSQKDRPRVASSVKTKLVMRTVLNGMREDIYELKQAGWVDDYECTSLLRSLAERDRYVDGIKFVQPPSPKQMFKEVSWMGDDNNIFNFLYDNVVSKKFDSMEVVCDEGECIEGIYILITGLLKETYEAKKTVLEDLNRTGILPIVDYVSAIQYDESISDYIVSSNCVGELSTITGRPYNCMITAAALSQVFVIKKEVLRQAMAMDPDPVNGLECRLWKTVGFRIAVPVMANVPAYRTFTQEQIKFTLERSFVPNLSNYKVFLVHEMMEDVILIEGMVVDFNTKDIYTAPCYIPRSVQKFILPKSSMMKLNTEIETKFLIIPSKGYDKYQIMLEEEATCELVSDDPSKSLRHFMKTYNKKILTQAEALMLKGGTTTKKFSRKSTNRSNKGEDGDSECKVTLTDNGAAIVKMDQEKSVTST